MTVDDLKAYFGPSWNRSLQMAFDTPISNQAIYGWCVEGIPPLRQIQLEIMTDRALKADPGLLPDYRYIKNPNTDRFEKVYRDETLRKTG